MECWDNLAWGSWIGKACPAAAGWHGQHRADSRAWKAVLDSPPLPWSTKSPWLCPWEAASCALRWGQAAGQPFILPCAVEAEKGKAEGLKLQLRGKHLRPGSLELLLDWHQHLSSSSCLNSSAFISRLCRHRRPIQAERYIWLSSGDRQDETTAILFQMRQGLPVWEGLQEPRDQRNNWSPEQKKEHPRVLFYSNTGDQGKVKAWSTLKQNPSAGTKRSKTHILQRGQPAPQEMHSIWPNKSIQSSQNSYFSLTTRWAFPSSTKVSMMQKVPCWTWPEPHIFSSREKEMQDWASPLKHLVSVLHHRRYFSRFDRISKGGRSFIYQGLTALRFIPARMQRCFRSSGAGAQQALLIEGC